MSVKWISYIWDKTDYKEGELLTALALADFANDEGECFPYIETIAKKARLSVRQIQKIIHNFEADSFLKVERFQGRGKKPKFHLQKVNSTTPFADRKKVNSATLKGELCDIEKVNSATFPIYKDEPSLEPSKEKREDAPDGAHAPREENESDNQPDEPPYPLPENPQAPSPPAAPPFTSPSVGELLRRTENAVGFMLPIEIIRRLHENIPEKLLDKWIDFVKDRMCGLVGAHQNFIKSKFGYWFGDFKQKFKFEIEQAKPSKWYHDLETTEKPKKWMH